MGKVKKRGANRDGFGSDPKTILIFQDKRRYKIF